MLCPRQNQPRIGSLYTFKAQFNPFVKIKGTLDMLFFAQYIGPIGAIAKNINQYTFGAVNLEYHLDLIASGEANLDLPLVTYHSIDGWGGVEIKMDFQFSLMLDAGGKASVDIPTIGSVNASIDTKAKASFSITATYDKRTNTCPGTLKFDGLKAEIYIELKAETKDNTTIPKKEKPKIITLLELQSWQVSLL